jgi:DNA polymerase-4
MILHVDMDAFYASVEQLDDPKLQGRCVIVGGTSGRGVVSAANYEARKYGVHSAMPMFEARRKCPHGNFLPPRMERYRQISRRVMEVLRRYTPLVEPVSIDEAYLDIGGCGRLFGCPETLGRCLKQDILAAVRLTCSVGIAPARFLAKIASEMQKPDGLTVITPEAVPVVLRKLPVCRVPGVGAKTLRRLEAIGIRTLGDVQGLPERFLCQQLGKYGRRLQELSEGFDPTPISPGRPHKSVSAERTFDEDTRDPERLRRHLLEQSGEVAGELRKMGVQARTVVLKIKHADFHLVTRSATLAQPTRSSDTIYRQACALLERCPLTESVRLIGVGAANLTSRATAVQLELFGDNRPGGKTWEKVDSAMDRIIQKFGEGAVHRANVKNTR